MVALIYLIMHIELSVHIPNSYSLLLQCWDGQPEERPDFRQLVVTIAAMLEEVSGYLSLNIIEKRNLAPDTHVLYYNLGSYN